MYLNQSIVQLHQTYKSLLDSIIDSVVHQTITISKYKPLAGSSLQS